jgi:hypothetical protein
LPEPTGDAGFNNERREAPNSAEAIEAKVLCGQLCGQGVGPPRFAFLDCSHQMPPVGMTDCSRPATPCIGSKGPNRTSCFENATHIRRRGVLGRTALFPQRCPISFWFTLSLPFVLFATSSAFKCTTTLIFFFVFYAHAPLIPLRYLEAMLSEAVLQGRHWPLEQISTRPPRQSPGLIYVAKRHIQWVDFLYLIHRHGYVAHDMWRSALNTDLFVRDMPT